MSRRQLYAQALDCDASKDMLMETMQAYMQKVIDASKGSSPVIHATRETVEQMTLVYLKGGVDAPQ